jgi:predicted phosphodiesterase
MQVPDWNLQNLFNLPLRNASVRPVSIPVDRSLPMRVLVVSDTHIGRSDPSDPEPSKVQYLAELEDLVRFEHATHLLHLGDLVDNTAENGLVHLVDCLRRFEALGIPVYTIHGNHDLIFYCLVQWPESPTLHLTDESALLLDIPAAPGKDDATRIFLAHDLENSFKIRDQFAFMFAFWMKEAFQETIKPDDWLLLGHTHTQCLSAECKVGCVGQYAPAENAWTYTVIDIGEEVSIEMKHRLSKVRKS